MQSQEQGGKHEKGNLTLIVLGTELSILHTV